jgi:hypothetical protein
VEQVFTETIKEVLKKHFGEQFEEIFENSQLIQYLNQKTKSANRGARASLANDFQNRKGEYFIHQIVSKTKSIAFEKLLIYKDFNLSKAIIEIIFEIVSYAILKYLLRQSNLLRF